jgi:hypothetical protein
MVYCSTLISIVCRWFAIEIGYSAKIDATGIWLCGPVRKARAANGQIRSEICWIFWHYDGDRLVLGRRR